MLNNMHILNLSYLNRKLIKNKEEYIPNRQPPWVDHPPKSNEIPDTLINYQE
jgi:hypothetical protein